MNLTTIPVKFGKVSGRFWCSNNKLTSLEGCPVEVGGWFDCSKNKLISLKGAPKEVGGWFDCTNNKVKFTKDDIIAVCNVKYDDIFI